LYILTVVALLALTFGSVFVATGQSQPHTYYACATSSGQLTQIRVDAEPTCGPNQHVVSWASGGVPSWNELADVPADLQDGSVDWTEVDGVPSDLADGDDVGLTSVGWNDIQGVPAGFADAIDDIDGGTAADLNCLECVDANEIVDASITADDLATDSVGSDEVNDDSLTASDLAEGSVGSSELTDGGIGTNDLSDGAVTTSKQTANVLQATGSPSQLDNGVTTTLIGPWPFTPGGAITDTHVVLVSIVIDLRCQLCDANGGNVATVDVTARDDTLALNLARTVEFVEPNQTETVTISQLLFLNGGAPTNVVIEATTTATGAAVVTFDDGNVVLADLGRTP
jgi:hypothetical protein